MSKWFGFSESAPHIPSDDLGTILSKAVEQQDKLGWDNFAKGRVSNLWKEAQQIHISLFHPNASSTKNKWATGLISAIWR
eukprot:10553226-Ditylum_brightwellii.AAC.1